MAEGVALPGPGDRLAEEGAAVVRVRSSLVPRVAVILGSGLGSVLPIEEDARFPFTDLPGFPAPSVPGHLGSLVLGTAAGVPVAAFLGRVHYYEGNPMAVASLPVRLAAQLGARALLVTASVGGLDPDVPAGSVVVGTDHLNLMGENPLRGWRDAEGRPPFVELTHVYDRDLVRGALEAAVELGVPARPGIYLAVSGPTYETPAEVAFMRKAGGTVVGMSVVPEVVPAAALGMRVLGLYLVTNTAGGVDVSHQEVLETADRMAASVGRLIERVLPSMIEG